MKNVIPIIVAVALGVIAGIAVRAPAVQRLKDDLAKSKAETAELKEQLERAQRVTNGRERFNNGNGRRPAPVREVVTEPVVEDVETQAVAVAETPAPAPERTIADAEAEREARRQEFMDRIRQQAAEERAAFVESQQLNEAQVQAFDTIMVDLNQRVGDIAEQWADYIRQTGKMENDFGMRMMHDVSGAMVVAYDAMDTSFPSWRTSMPRGGMGWVDPSAYEPIITVVREIDPNMRNFRMPMPGMNMRGGPGAGGPPPRQR